MAVSGFPEPTGGHVSRPGSRFLRMSLCIYKSVAPHLIKKTLSSLLSLLGIRGGACCHGPSAQAVQQNGEALQFASEDLRDTRKADGPCRNTAGNMLKHQLAA